jgi:DNA mismatch repair protein MutL
MWFLNGRPLRDRMLLRLPAGGLPRLRRPPAPPVAFLALAVPPEAVDVNVHPTKSEVRFRDERRLFPFLLTRLREAVGAHGHGDTRRDAPAAAASVMASPASWTSAAPAPGEVEVRERPALEEAELATAELIPAARTPPRPCCRSRARTSCASSRAGSRSSTSTRCTSA